MLPKAMKMSMVIGAISLLVMPAVIPAESGGVDGADEVITVSVSSAHRPGTANTVEKTITVREAQELRQACTAAASEFKVLYDEEASEEDKDRAEEIIENAVSMMKELDLLPEGQTEATVLRWIFGPSRGFDFMSPVVSCGKGFSWIPFYAGEAFLGIMLRPMFTLYPVMGYTGYLSVNLLPPRIQYWDLVGPQVFMSWGFVGIYINFGKILLGVPNTTFMLGYSLANAGISLL